MKQHGRTIRAAFVALLLALGMSVVFYDDCDFPSGTAGNQMAEQYPDDLMKYLARATATVQGPGEAVLPVASGTLMSVVAKNLDTGGWRVVTAEARSGGPAAATIEGSAGFRQPPEEEGRFEFFRVLDADGKLLFEDRFEGQLNSVWEKPGPSRVEPDGLHATDCQPMRIKGLKLPAKFTIESRLAVVRSAASIAFGVQSDDDFLFWQFFANASALEISADVQLRGSWRLESWDPHTGTIRPLEATSAHQDGEPVTRLKLALPPIRSIFIIGKSIS